jgi:hypothetical protein
LQEYITANGQQAVPERAAAAVTVSPGAANLRFARQIEIFS